MSRGAACGPPFGMGWDVESSGAGDGLPPVFWFLLGFRVSDGPVGGNNSTGVHVWSRGSCHSPQRAYGPIPFPAGGSGITLTLTLTLSHHRERGQDFSPPDPSRSLGMTGLRGWGAICAAMTGVIRDGLFLLFCYSAQMNVKAGCVNFYLGGFHGAE